MKLVFTIIFSLITLFPAISQDKKLKVGGRAKESVKYRDKTNANQVYYIPSAFHLLLYNFMDANGNTDNADSIVKLEDKISILLNKLKRSEEFKELYIVAFAQMKNFSEFTSITKNFNTAIIEAFAKNNKNHHKLLIIQEYDEFKKSDILNAGKLTLLDAKGKILEIGNLTDFPYASLGEARAVRGKLLTESNGKKVPLANTRVSLLNQSNSSVSESVTDKFGDFELNSPDGSNYILNAKPDDKSVKKVILANLGGKEIGTMTKTKDGFQFPNLPADLSKLLEVENNDDITMSFNKFKGTGKTALKITENISYESGQYKIEKSAEEVLDKVVIILKENKTYKLDVISHTDSQGEDAANLALSEKRSKAVLEYLVSKGINNARLNATGKGETALRNRCANGIECSDREHAYNRRTEFHFTR